MSSKQAVSSKRPLRRHESSFDLQRKGNTGTNESAIPKQSTKPKQTLVKAPAKTNNSKKVAAKQDTDNNANEQFDRMIEGKLTNIPNVPRSVVRIFLSSTFSDMRAERNALVQMVAPKLKEFCSQYDLDFQLVDMRWGVTDDSQNDHTVEKICLLEVENCKKISLGTNFVLMLGNRYGFRPIPTEVDVDEFKTLLSYVTNNSDAILLNTWYILDENSCPPQFVLQPIRKQFPSFGEYKTGSEEARAKDTKNWQTTFSELQNILRQAASHAFNDKKMNKQQYDKYFFSVTEMEIRSGITEAENPKSHVLVYYRNLTGLSDDVLTQKNANRYANVMDINGKVTLDKDTDNLRKGIYKSVKNKLGEKNCKEFSVPWRDGGVDPYKHKEHDDYIGDLCISILEEVTGQIENALENNLPDIWWSEYYTDYHELIHHLTFCKTKVETFCGQTDVLQNVKDYILSDTTRKPLVLHAPSGAGKTSIMAMIMKSLQSWFGQKKYLSIIRFIGTSPLSTNIYNVMFGVAGQLADDADIIMEPVMYKSMDKLVEYIPRFLRRAANSLKVPIVILLDSLDQLSALDDAYSLKWLPLTLPPNVRLVVSTLPEEHGILQNLKTLIPIPNSSVEVPPLSTSTGREITSVYLKKKRRTITESQIKHLLAYFEKSPGPLFLKLLLDQAVQWKSYSQESEMALADSVQQAISQLFANLEKKFGQVVISKTLGYITIGLNGISEIEIEDVLSCDDDALNDVYRYHNPPVEGIVRIPPVLWARIRYDLKEYLVERRLFNKYTLTWYHRQFIETAKARYLSGTDGEILHANMVELFLAENGVKKSIRLEWRNITVENGDRQVTHQPMTSHNKRMLASLPYHIINAADKISVETAMEKCFCNFNFLKAKITAFKIDGVLEDMKKFVAKSGNKEIQTLLNFFTNSKVDIANYVRLAVGMLSCIAPDDKHFHLKRLLDEARGFLSTHANQVLIPRYPCLSFRRDSSSALVSCLVDCEDIVCNNSEFILVKTSGNKNEESHDTYVLYNLTSDESQFVSLPKKPNLTPYIDPSGKKIIYVDGSSINAVNLSKMKTTTKNIGDLTGNTGKKEFIPVITASSSDFSRLAIVFQNNSLLVLDTSSLQKLFFTTLSGNYGKISGVLCGSTEKLTVVITGKVKDGKQGNVGKEFIQVINASTDGSGNNASNFKELQTDLTDYHVGMDAADEVLVTAYNSGDTGFVVSFAVDTLEEICKVTFKQHICHLVVGRSSDEGAVLNANGDVTTFNCKNGIITKELQVNKPAICLSIDWQHGQAYIGDEQGQLTLYNIPTSKALWSFSAHANSVEKIMVVDDQVVTLGGDQEAKIWSVQALQESLVKHVSNEKQGNMSDLLDMKEASCFDVCMDTQELVIASRNQTIYIWQLESLQFLRKHTVQFNVTAIVTLCKNVALVFEYSSGTIQVLDLKTGNAFASNLPGNVLDFVVGQDKENLFTISQKEKGLLVDIYSLKYMKPVKSFHLKQSLAYKSLGISLSADDRYMILRIEVTEKEYKTIEASWSKQGRFMPQPHPYRYSSVDLSLGTGGLTSCLRNMTSIPYLAEVVKPLKGNLAVMATNDWIIVWDLPTGKSGARVSKVQRKTMFFRNVWLDESQCWGTSRAIAVTKNEKHVAIGSDDGYVFIYDTESGLPAQRKVPATKHSAPVIQLLASPDSRWVVSACRNNTLKVWDTNSGKECFSTRVNSTVTSMKFSRDTLVVLTGTDSTRVLVYTLHPGQ